MEKLFHSKWWDYSNNKFNINGRVCLLNSILFGLMSVFVMFVLHVKIENIIGSISYVWIQVLAISIIVIVTVDITITVQSVLNLNEKLQKLRDLSSEIKEKLDEKQSYIEAKIHEGIHVKFFERRLIHAFPDMKSIKFQEQFQNLKSELEKIRSKNK